MIIFSRFSEGEPAVFDLALLKDILKAHHCDLGMPSARAYIPVFFPMENGEELIGSDEGGIAVEDGGAIEFSIGRPLYDEPMKQLAFTLLDRLNLCAYGDGAHVYCAHPIDEAAIPDDVLDDCDDGVLVVSSPTQLW